MCRRRRAAAVAAENMECVSGDADAMTDAGGIDQRQPRPWLMAGAGVLLAAACAGTLVAWTGYVGLCDPSCVPPPRHLTAQLVIAVIGLIATAAMTACVAQGRNRAAVALLLAAMGLYLAWGVVLDQATHGSYFWQ
jgi:hypothetical protein